MTVKCLGLYYYHVQGAGMAASERSQYSATNPCPVASLTAEGSRDEGAGEIQEHEHFRTYRRVVRNQNRRAEFGFTIVVGAVVCDVASRRVGLSRRAAANLDA